MYQPTPHRVINADPTRSRVSIPFFYEPCYEALIQAPEELVHKTNNRYDCDNICGRMRDVY